MIELPPNPSTIKPTAASETATVGDAKALAQQTIQAQVVAVRALPQQASQQAAAQAQKQLYEILLQAKVSNSGSIDQSLFQSTTTTKFAQSPITQVTQAVLQSLQQGKTLQIKTQAQFPLPLSTQVLANLSISKGIVIKAVQPPLATLPQAIALKQLVPQQQSMGAIISNAVNLLLNKPDTIQKLTPDLQIQLRSLMSNVPSLRELTKPDGVQKAIQNSGISFEAKLNTLSQDQKLNQQSHPTADKLGVGETLKVLSKRLMQANSSDNASATSRKTSVNGEDVQTGEKARTNQIPNGDSNSVSKERFLSINADLKQQLYALQKALQQAPQLETAKQEGTKPEGTNPEGTKPEALKQVAVKQGEFKSDNNSTIKSAEFGNKNNGEGVKITSPANKPDDITNLKKIIAENGTRKPSSPIHHHAVKHYQTQTPAPTTTVTTTAERVTSTSETLLLPPLPGQIQVQAQPQVSPTIKGNEMADALVSILLKQVKGAIARVTLHQMASQTQRQEGQTGNTLLSFELPFLHNNQANVMQFKIEEELEQKKPGEKQQEKRWVVQMGFDIEGLGPMLCQINLVKHSASVSFWAEWENTLSHTKAHVDYLQTALQEMGLKVEKLQGHLGIPTKEKARLTNQLVDIKT